VAFPASGDNPLEELLHSRVLPSGVWIGGRNVSSLDIER
jgi:hypothetical protein